MDQGRQSTGYPNEHIDPQQRAGEVAYLLQQARGECLADVDRVEDARARELFGKVAGYLEVAIQALYSYQGGNEHAERILH